MKYRQRGRFDVAIRNLRAMADEKRRAGRDLPFLNWRYILFVWNDSDEEMALARQMAADIGVDRLCWELTDHPENAYSRRFVPGSPDARGDSPRDLGRQQPRQRDSWRHAARPHRRAHARARRRRTPADGARRPADSGADAHPQPLDAPLPGPGHLRPPTRPPRRATLRCQRRRHRPRFRARVAARTRSAPGKAKPTSPIDIPSPAQPGHYTLKFDLVSEGVDWFENCGSPTTMKSLWVR